MDFKPYKAQLNTFTIRLAKFSFKPYWFCMLVPGGEYEGDSLLTQYMIVSFKWCGIGVFGKTKFNG